MIRPIFVFKTLLFSLILNFVFVVYLLYYQSSQSFLTDTSKQQYDVNDYYSIYDRSFLPANIKIIPLPMFIHVEHSKIYLTNRFHIISNQKSTTDLQSTISRYAKYISLLTSISVNSEQHRQPSDYTLVIDCPTIQSKKNHYPKLGEDEYYRLNINKTAMILQASTLTGIVRGLATFVQLIEHDKSTGKSYVPYANIIDRPRFPWRGLMLDVCRHWLSLPVIERTLNAMELSKLNVLHLHLSDDQGFRAESIQYPLLHDRKNFFSQKELRHIVEFARQRRIRVVPEFDIPGHTTSWFVGYPDLATVNMTYEVGIRWGVMKATMDPTKESTYTFLDGFFKEMTDIFPDPYFHIGGDEVEGSQWMQSPTIQKFINEHNLMNKNGLQAFFNRRIQTMLKKYNRIMVGWEEILDEISDNLAVDKDAIIHSWKSRKSLLNTINKGYRGLLSHGFYLDHLVSSGTHYRIDPILEDELWIYNEEQLSHILGGEACMWTEYASENSIDSRLWPRTLAIAERFWSPSSINNEKYLYERLFRMNHLLDKLQTGVNHLSSYKQRLQSLISDSDQKVSLLHPFVILADVCEPYGFEQRAQSGRYSASVSLTTFNDALQAESEVIWKLENQPIDPKIFRQIFHTWSLNDIRLRRLFDGMHTNQNQQLWGQDIERLSKNLAQTGQIGLRALDYSEKRILHPDQNHSMNSWPVMQWISHYTSILNQLENQVNEIRLAAVKPVRRLFRSLELTLN